MFLMDVQKDRKLKKRERRRESPIDIDGDERLKEDRVVHIVAYIKVICTKWN